MHSNGTLALATVTRDADEGTYKCTAVDKQGRSDSQTMDLQIKSVSLVIVVNCGIKNNGNRIPSVKRYRVDKKKHIVNSMF